jgi:hypothetical protein
MPYINQQQTIHNDNWPIQGTGGSNESGCQSFKCTGADTYAKVDLYLQKVLLPTDNLTLRIETNNAGAPSGTLVDASATKTIAAAGVTTGWNTFKFPAAFAMTAATTFWLVLARSGARDTNNYVLWWADSGASYADGAGFRLNSSVWTPLSEDFTFIIYNKSYPRTMVITE